MEEDRDIYGLKGEMATEKLKFFNVLMILSFLNFLKIFESHWVVVVKSSPFIHSSVFGFFFFSFSFCPGKVH